MLPNLDVAGGRYVLTYEVEGWPVGIITGEHVKQAKAFHLEHMILFTGQNPMYLTQMLAAALKYAHGYPLDMVTFRIVKGQPHEKTLRRLALRHGFEQGLSDDVYYITRERMV